MTPNAMRHVLVSSTGLVVALGTASTAMAQTDTAGRYRWHQHGRLPEGASNV